LNRAKQLTTADAKFGEPDDRKKLLAITYNNMSCIYKRRGLLKTALGFAEKALKLETSSSKADNPATTHLNLCAILSRLDRHRHALEHCQCALALLKDEGYSGGVTPGLMGESYLLPQTALTLARPAALCCIYVCAVYTFVLAATDDHAPAAFPSLRVSLFFSPPPVFRGPGRRP
jgi:tetratricopeptide (TPR) repeat protein